MRLINIINITINTQNIGKENNAKMACSNGIKLSGFFYEKIKHYRKNNHSNYCYHKLKK